MPTAAPNPTAFFPLPLLSVLCAALLLSSATLHAASSPAIDLTSPKAAAHTLWRAVQAHDRAAIRAVLYAPTDSEARLADAYTDLILAGRELSDASAAKYGDAGNKMNAGMMTPDGLASIDDARIQNQSADTATLIPAGQSRPISFHLQDGAWRLVVTEPDRASDDDIRKQLELLTGMTQVMHESAQEIAAGKYPTPREAETAIARKCTAVMIAQAEKLMHEEDRQAHDSKPLPPTRPASQP